MTSISKNCIKIHFFSFICKFCASINQWVLSLLAAVCAQPNLLAVVAQGLASGNEDFQFKIISLFHSDFAWKQKVDYNSAFSSCF